MHRYFLRFLVSERFIFASISLATLSSNHVGIHLSQPIRTQLAVKLLKMWYVKPPVTIKKKKSGNLNAISNMCAKHGNKKSTTVRAMPSTPYADEYEPSNLEALLPVIQSKPTTIIRIKIQIRLVFPYTRLKNVPTPPLTNEAALNCAVLKISIILRLLKISLTRSNCSPPFT
ncbi:prophage LambdaBa02, holin [Bacillus thuringiensis serovar sotto str. T04001]|nr:prophage LambdaBa02, holin [Bacillus thuringiensis serovar sotto str. T04001]